MNSTRTVLVTLDLIKEALEHYWRSSALIKPNEEVQISIGSHKDLDRTITATINSTKEVVEVFRI